MTSVCDEFGGGRTARPSTRSRWLFAVVVFAIGIVPVTAIAKAVCAVAVRLVLVRRTPWSAAIRGIESRRTPRSR